MERSCPVVFVCEPDALARETATAWFTAAGLRTRAYASTDQLLTDCQGSTPGCVVLGRTAADDDGPDFYESAQARALNLPVIQLLEPRGVEAAVHALRHGALDVLERPVSPSTLVQRTREALAQAVARYPAQQEQVQYAARLRSLTARERKVLKRTLAGETAKQTATTLDVSLRTVQLDREHIIRKMGVKSLIQLAHIL